MMQRYVFLDVDGVLNSRSWYERRPPRPEPCSREQHHRHQIDPDAVNLVNRLCEEAEALVVVSSTWRGMMPWLMAALRGYRTFEVIDKTGHRNDGIRGREIQEWMDRYGVTPEQIVILDDDSDMVHLMPRLVLTNHDAGITEADVEKALRLFGVGK